MVDAPRILNGPDEISRELARIDDEQLTLDLRDALGALGYLADIWWAQVGPTASSVQRRGQQAIADARDGVALLGGNATLDELARIVHPLLGDYFDTPDLNAAVDAIRDVTMHRWSMIKRAREEMATWKANQLRTVC